MITRVSFKHWSMTCACYSSSQHKPSLSLLVDLTAGHKSFSCYSYVLCPCPSSGNSIIMSSTLLSVFFFTAVVESFLISCSILSHFRRGIQKKYRNFQLKFLSTLITVAFWPVSHHKRWQRSSILNALLKCFWP